MVLVETGIWAKRERSILGETGPARVVDHRYANGDDDNDSGGSDGSTVRSV